MPLPLPRSILVVGSGGREHTIVSACLKSPSRPRVLAAPGNGGIARDVKCFPIPVEDVPGLVALAKKERVEFVIVGPEVPLSLGLVDALIAAGIPAYGPKADGARLEASKIFTKELLLKYKIPTAPAKFFTEVAPAVAYLKTRKAPYVIKADGLAAGKGVVVTPEFKEAEAAVKMMLEGGAFGASGKRILIEDCLHGEETSIHLVVSGREFVMLPTSQDHKRVGDGDTGPNTGGMGAYSPAEVVTAKLLAEIEKTICRPSVDAIAAEGIDYRGTLYIGIMLTPKGPQVIEFNARFGDPETQVLLPRLATDTVELLWAAANNRLHEVKLEVKSDYALCVVLAAQGYPDKYPKGDAITLPRVSGAGEYIFHAGTAVSSNRQIVTNGGRVLGVTALAPTLRQAARSAYALCDQIGFVSKYCRRDIGAKQLNRK
jgi:phosphoribosylamine--glycine ligase